MFFLLRMAFWLGVVVLLLPTGNTQPAAPGPQVGTVEAMSAAGAALSDMGQFCSRQPDACTVGSHAAVAFGQKAQASAKMLYEFFTEKLGPSATGSVATAPTGKTLASDRTGQDTLTPADRIPEWRSPVPRRDDQPGRAA
jgi:hypothetical protein